MSRARDLADRVLHNRTHEDTDGGRESIVTFKGEQSGGEISTLAQIQASHDGTGDDQKSDLIFKTNDGSDGASPTEAARIDSQSNFLIGHSDNTNVAGHEAGLQIVGQGTADYHGATVSIVGNANNADGAYLNFGKSRSNTAGTATAAAAGDVVGMLQFSAADGTDFANRVAFIMAKVNGNVSSNDTPGRLEFYTTPAGSGTPAIRLRIDDNGIKFGSDTAEANGLNDYEEGDYTATITCTSGSITLDPSYNQLSYTKIGRAVTISGRVNIDSVSSPSGSAILNLPFVVASGTDHSGYGGLTIFHHDINLGSGGVALFGESAPTTSYSTINILYNNASWNYSGSIFDGSGNEWMYFSGTYLTT